MRQNNPTGKSAKTCPALALKNIPLNPSGKSALPTRPSHPTRGALRNVTNARWDAVDAAACKTNVSLLRTAKSCGPGAPVLALSFARSKLLRDDGGNKPVTGESSKETVKPSRRESRIASAGPVCSCALSFAQIAHETAGAARTRLSLRPLYTEGRSGCKPRAYHAAGTRTFVTGVIAREGGRSSIPEKSVNEPRSHRVLDAPPARGMTA